MTCSTKNILVISAITVVVTVSILLFAFWLVTRTTNNDDDTTPIGDCSTFAGVWYKENGDKKNGYAIFSIGVCTSDETGEPQPFVDTEGEQWPLCGTLFVNNIKSSFVNGTEIYCSDCKFRTNDICGIEMRSSCLAKFANQKTDFIFAGNNGNGWKITDDGNTISTKYGKYIAISPEQFPNKYIKGGNTPVIDTCDNTVLTKTGCTVRGKNWTSCPDSQKGCCCDNDLNSSCCEAQSSNKRNSILEFLGLEPKIP